MGLGKLNPGCNCCKVGDCHLCSDSHGDMEVAISDLVDEDCNECAFYSDTFLLTPLDGPGNECTWIHTFSNNACYGQIRVFLTNPSSGVVRVLVRLFGHSGTITDFRREIQQDPPIACQTEINGLVCDPDFDDSPACDFGPNAQAAVTILAP